MANQNIIQYARPAGHRPRNILGVVSLLVSLATCPFALGCVIPVFVVSPLFPQAFRTWNLQVRLALPTGALVLSIWTIWRIQRSKPQSTGLTCAFWSLVIALLSITLQLVAVRIMVLVLPSFAK